MITPLENQFVPIISQVVSAAQHPRDSRLPVTDNRRVVGPTLLCHMSHAVYGYRQENNLLKSQI
jgi:hypothetical protein